MKSYSFIITLAIAALLSVDALAQNAPNNSVLSSGAASKEITYPLDFNANPNRSHTTFNYTRVYSPLIPMTSLPSFDNTKLLRVQVGTSYLNGWGAPLMNVSRNGSNYDVIGLYSYRSSSDTAISYLPYADTFHSKFHNAIYTRQKNYYSTNFANEGTTAYSKTIAANPSGVPTVKSFMPGKAFTGADTGVIVTADYNVTSEIPYLIYGSFNKEICTFNAYAADQLKITYRVGQHNQAVKTYSDKEGKLICRKQYIGDATGNSGWLVTYYMYDELDRIKYIVPPKAYKMLASGCIDSNAVKNLCYTYSYDKYGHLVSVQIPGKDKQDLAIYNGNNQQVMIQTPNLNGQGKWYFTIYDKMDRPLFSGIYTSDDPYIDSAGYWQNVSKNIGFPYDRYRGGSPVPAAQTLEYWLAGKFSYGEYPDSLWNCEIHSYQYYDYYEQSPANARSFTSYTNFLTGTGIETPTAYMLPQGKLVATKVKILDTTGITNHFTNTWLTSVYFYDEKSRLIQLHRQNPWNHWDVITTQYNFADQPVLDIADYQLSNFSNKKNTKIVTTYTYHTKTGRLLNVSQKVDTFVSVPLADLTYDELGRVKQVWQGGNVQQQNYRYNMRGQLTGINADNVRDGTLPEDMSYASELCYERGFDSARYDGGLSGYKWHSASSNFSAYGYRYDPAGRMIYADFNDSSGSSWNKSSLDYTVSNIAYDANGNITYMKQRGYDSTHAPTDMDLLTYTYATNSNRLVKVDDAGNPSPIHAFVDGSNGGDDYAYDANGNLVADSNKHIQSIVYNHLDKMVSVDKNGSDNLKNIYDASGNLLQKMIVENGDTETYTYWGPFTMRNDSLQYMVHHEGRARWLADSSIFKYDYFVKDHQGNVRTIATQDITQGPELHAGFEYVRANIEDAIFDQVGTIRDWNPQGTPGDLMSGSLDGCDPDKRIGASVLLHVMAGDQVNLQAYGYYESTDSTDMNTYPVSSEMLTALTNALTGGGAVTGGGDLGTGISSGTINTLLNSTNYAVYDALKNSATDPNYPRTYLNYLVFNEGMDIQADQCKVVQLTGSPNTWNLMQFTGNMNITANGYVLCYLSNESCMPVSVDNENIITVKGRLMEEQHYYPHGLVVEDGGQQNTPIPNKYLFETNKMQGELGLELLDFNARNYDQQIGRFTAVDPLADAGQEQWSPYHFVGGDPANFTDPSGLGGIRFLSCFIGGDDGSKYLKRERKAGKNDEGSSDDNTQADEGQHSGGDGPSTPGANGSGLPSAAVLAALSGPSGSGSSSSGPPGGGHSTGGPGTPNPDSYGPDNPANYWAKKQGELNQKLTEMLQPKIGKDNTPVKNKYESGRTTKVEVYIWSKESGKNIDVGHTAIRVGDVIYGYYPTDVNGNDRYDYDELMGSPGQMHVQNIGQFNASYKSDEITSFEVQITEKQLSSLIHNLDRVVNNPGTYSLNGNQCTSVAMNILIKSGVNIQAPYTSVANPVFLGIRPLKNGYGTSPTGLKNILNIPQNQPTFINKGVFKVY